MLSMRVACFSPYNNDTPISKNLDFLEERCDMASVQLNNYQQKLAQRYNRNVKPREFVVGNLVLQNVMGSMRD